VDQDPLGKPGRRVWKQGPLEVWARDLEDGGKAVGLFSRGEGTVEVAATWADVGVSGKQTVRDLWRQQQAGVFDGRIRDARRPARCRIREAHAGAMRGGLRDGPPIRCQIRRPSSTLPIRVAVPSQPKRSVMIRP